MTTSRGAAPRARSPEALKPAQELVLEEFAEGLEEITRADYERIGHVSRSQAAYDLAELVDRRVLERVGSGRATRYRPTKPRSGRPRSWTDERIHEELEEFCAGHDSWPSAAEFRSSGHGSLYLAVCRYGGIDRWADHIGLARDTHAPEPEPVTSTEKPERPKRRPVTETLRPVVALLRPAAAALALLAGAAGAALLVPGEPDELRLAGGPQQGADGSATARPQASDSSAAHREIPAESSGRSRAVTVELVGAGRDSRIEARRTDRDGRVLFTGLLREGASIELEGRRIWLRLERAAAVRLVIDGSRAPVARRARTLLVTKNRVRVLRAKPRPPQEAQPSPAGSSEIPVSAAEPAPVAPAPSAPVASSPPPPPATGSASSPDDGRPAPEPPGEAPAPDPKPD